MSSSDLVVPSLSYRCSTHKRPKYQKIHFSKISVSVLIISGQPLVLGCLYLASKYSLEAFLSHLQASIVMIVHFHICGVKFIVVPLCLPCPPPLPSSLCFMFHLKVFSGKPSQPPPTPPSHTNPQEFWWPFCDVKWYSLQPLAQILPYYKKHRTVLFIRKLLKCKGLGLT